MVCHGLPLVKKRNQGTIQLSHCAVGEWDVMSDLNYTSTTKNSTCAVGERDGPIPLHLDYPIYLCWPHPTINTTQRHTRVQEPDSTWCRRGAHCAPPSWVEPIMCPGCGSRLPPLTTTSQNPKLKHYPVWTWLTLDGQTGQNLLWEPPAKWHQPTKPKRPWSKNKLNTERNSNLTKTSQTTWVPPELASNKGTDRGSAPPNQEHVGYWHRWLPLRTLENTAGATRTSGKH